jgi:PhoPQ-activated pathogenicity-related protein
MQKFTSRRLRLAASPFAALALLLVWGCGSRAQAPSTPDLGGPVHTALDDYIARPEPVYQWSKVSEKKIGKNTVTTLDVTSQTWQGIVWKQKVEIAVPDENDFPGTALVYLSTADSAMESLLMQSLALRVRATIIHVMGMPNQPLWKMREDDLIAHTFMKTLETGDKTWPLLLPMTKGAVKALDAVQEYSRQEGKPLEKFVITGASKRGWTTWLVGATDTKNRVIGIIPIVYDNLNLGAQMPHQLESWGKYSPMIEDYTRRGIQAQLATEKGQQLGQIVDPYAYRARLTMPKLIVNAANDPYWTLDALNLYWNDLPEPKSVYYAPNAGHSMEGAYEGVFGTMGAWFRLVASGKPVPKIEKYFQMPMSFGTHFAPLLVLVSEQDKVKSVQFWIARSKTRDFRESHWTVEPPREQLDANQLKRKGKVGYSYSLKLPTAKADIPENEFPYVAAFATVTFEDESSLKLSTPVSIYAPFKNLSE